MAGKKGKSGGTNSKYTQETYEQMKTYLVAGLSLRDACALAGIAYSTWNGYEQHNPELRRERKQWQEKLKARAQLNIAEQIYGNKKKGIAPSIQMSMYLLEREEQKAAKNAKNAVYRANAVKLRAEAKQIEAEIKHLENGNDGITKIVFSDDLKPDKEDDSKQKGSEDDGTDTKPK